MRRFVKAIKVQSKILWQHTLTNTIFLETKMWYLTNTAKGRRLLSVGVSERKVRLASAQSTSSLKSQISVHSVPRFVKAIKFQSKILWQHNFIHTILLERKNWYLPCTAKGRHLLSVRGEYVCGGRVRQKTLRTIILFLSCVLRIVYAANGILMLPDLS